MKIFDITMPIHPGMPVYKNKPEKKPSFETTSDFSTGTSHETRIHLDAHTGTHVDAPLHMIENGDPIEAVSLQQLVRPCRVIDLTHVHDAIHAADLIAAAPQTGDFLLCKTSNSQDTAFNPEFVYLAEDGARYLAEQGIAGVGIDALGVERSQPEHTTHKTLFAAGAIIIEGLLLADIEPGVYLMVAAPLRLQGIDAAPARVMLLQDV